MTLEISSSIHVVVTVLLHQQLAVYFSTQRYAISPKEIASFIRILLLAFSRLQHFETHLAGSLEANGKMQK